MFDEIAYDVCQGREKLLSDNLPMFLFSDNLSMFLLSDNLPMFLFSENLMTMFLFSDNLTMFLISFFQICFDASPGQPHLQSIEFQIFFSYKIIPGIVNNTVNSDYKWNMPLSLKLPLCDY